MSRHVGLTLLSDRRGSERTESHQDHDAEKGAGEPGHPVAIVQARRRTNVPGAERKRIAFPFDRFGRERREEEQRERGDPRERVLLHRRSEEEERDEERVEEEPGVRGRRGALFHGAADRGDPSMRSPKPP